MHIRTDYSYHISEWTNKWEIRARLSMRRHVCNPSTSGRRTMSKRLTQQTGINKQNFSKCQLPSARCQVSGPSSSPFQWVLTLNLLMDAICPVLVHENYLCAHVCLCAWHMCLGAWGRPKKTGDPLKLGHCELTSMGADLTQVISKRSKCSSLLCSLPSPGDF